jgi:hypothetical protein
VEKENSLRKKKEETAIREQWAPSDEELISTSSA